MIIEGVCMVLKNKEIGGRIRRVRKEKGWTQERFAREFHMTQQTLSRYETGRVSIPNDALQSIAEGMGVSMGYFLGIDSVGLSEDEKGLLELYRGTDKRMRKYVYEIVKIMSVNFQGKDTEE